MRFTHSILLLVLVTVLGPVSGCADGFRPLGLFRESDPYGLSHTDWPETESEIRNLMRSLPQDLAGLPRSDEAGSSAWDEVNYGREAPGTEWADVSVWPVDGDWAPNGASMMLLIGSSAVADTHAEDIRSSADIAKGVALAEQGDEVALDEEFSALSMLEPDPGQLSWIECTLPGRSEAKQPRTPDSYRYVLGWSIGGWSYLVSGSSPESRDDLVAALRATAG